MLTRKQFLRSALDATAATLGLTVFYACTTSTPPPPGDALAVSGDGHGGASSGPDGGSHPQSCANGTMVTIGENHGHVLVVTTDEVQRGDAKTYHIQGMSDHDHTVALSADQFQSLANDRAIVTVSSTDAEHSHSIMVVCS